MATKKKAFKPLLVHYDDVGHMKAEKQAEDKLLLLDDASVWIHNQLDLDDAKINPKRLHLNMVECFKDLILHHYKDKNHLGLSATKLIDAKEIPLYQLEEIQKKYEAVDITTDVTFPNNVAMIEVKKSDYQIWTTSEKQNQKVILGNQFIKAIKELDNIGITVYPAHIQNATTGFIRYDLHKNMYIVNREFIFS